MMTAKDIEKMLRHKHAEDVFVAQCKTGPTQTGLLIMDGWAMKPSWANPLVTGYEIKISRGDYLRDDKWRGYLQYCNEFYFVTPSGLLEKDEVPNGCGLMVVAGSRLLTKKRAEYHEIGNAELLYKYVLMCHSGLIKTQSRNLSREERMAQWERAIEEKELLRQRGYMLSKKIREVIKSEIEDVKRESENIKRENETFLECREALKELGFSPGNYPRWGVKKTIADRIREIETGFPDSAKRSLETARQAIERIESLIKDI